MFGQTLRSVVRAAVVIERLGSGGSATAYVVDHNGGGQFLDIPPAIAAAQDGDVPPPLHPLRPGDPRSQHRRQLCDPDARRSEPADEQHARSGTGDSTDREG